MIIAIVGPMWSGREELAKVLEEEYNREAVVINSYHSVGLFSLCVDHPEDEILFVDLDIPKDACWRRAKELGVGKIGFETVYDYTSRHPDDFKLEAEDSLLKSVKFNADIPVEEIADVVDELLVKMQWKKEHPDEAEELEHEAQA